MTNVLAIDMGSSSLRGYAGQWDGSTLRLTEIYRHAHEVTQGDDGFTWDVKALMDSAVVACTRATDFFGAPPDSVAVDGWGVDFSPVDATGAPCGEAIAYRDSRGRHGRDLLRHELDEYRSFQLSGVAPQDINTINRLYLYGHNKQELPVETDSLMFLQDIVARHIATADISGWDPGDDPGPWASTGVASTSGILNSTHDDWDETLRGVTGVASSLFPRIGTELTEISHRGRTRLVRAGSHDTACAAFSLGVQPGDIFVSCGSWAVVGMITPQALTSTTAYEAGITNEASVEGANRAQLNLTGMWLSQECIRHWSAQEIDTSYERLGMLTEQAPSLGWILNPQDEQLAAPGNMPTRIVDMIHQHLGAVEERGITLDDPGVILRLLHESVANHIAQAIETLREQSALSGRVFIAGGATHNEFFTSRISHYLGEDIEIASAEATVIGNAKAQLRALGAISVTDTVDVLLNE